MGSPEESMGGSGGGMGGDIRGMSAPKPGGGGGMSALIPPGSREWYVEENKEYPQYTQNLFHEFNRRFIPKGKTEASYVDDIFGNYKMLTKDECKEYAEEKNLVFKEFRGRRAKLCTPSPRDPPGCHRMNRRRGDDVVRYNLNRDKCLKSNEKTVIHMKDYVPNGRRIRDRKSCSNQKKCILK